MVGGPINVPSPHHLLQRFRDAAQQCEQPAALGRAGTYVFDSFLYCRRCDR
jgi:hypothetical protein